MVQSNDFNALRLSLASPQQMYDWSYGKVTKPETINYRTLRPEKDGLFCERIFGPTKDWECSCGKYKKIRYRGMKCDRCGVEITRAKVRRERMGHIELAAPVAHIWFAKGIPSRLGLLLDLSPRNLERVLYFAQYLVTSVDEDARAKEVETLQQQMDQEMEAQEQANQATTETNGTSSVETATATTPKGKKRKPKNEIEEKYENLMDELEDLHTLQLLTDPRYRELRDRFSHVFKASMGAEALLEVLETLNLEDLREKLQQEIGSTSGQRRRKAIKRLSVVESLRKSGNKPSWMILTVLPVLPPELRPMVQLDGGRFATSDLNDLYRRVINRNNRLQRLMDIGAPEIIIRNEKRMLQEAADALIDNGRRGKAISGSHNHKLKSLTDLLRGKQGRFRQNLLGKRVDYSGRSVIIVGPTLKLHQCGLPQRMALELFKPFVMNRLVMDGLAINIKSAKRMVERVRPEIWDILEEVIKDRPVLLNRAPTLHRLGIQAFQPVLIEGSAIQVHPLICQAFNADFDGDQMAVHVPISREAVQEARKVMLSIYNMLSPSSGEPVVAPTLDMVLGCYYLTVIAAGKSGEGSRFNSMEEARLAYDLRVVDLQAEVLIRDQSAEDGWLKTSPGRIIFNEVLPADIGFQNRVIDKGALKEMVTLSYHLLGNEGTAEVLDRLKEMGFTYATKSGITIAINDVVVSPEKAGILEGADDKIKILEEQYQRGLISEEERYNSAITTWQEASDSLTDVIEKHLPEYGGLYVMTASGAKGNIAQIKQMAGMRGLMSNPRGRIIDLPIKSSFREGLSVLEYFISTHGARKGLTDTALRTADSGYLTRRLVDVSQDVVILEDDCETTLGIWIQEESEATLMAPFNELMVGRLAATPVVDPSTGEILVDRNQEIDELMARDIVSAGIDRIFIRSPLGCEAVRGLCRSCYGRSMATGRMAMPGEAVGIIAAQSIGEPGTQLTMRTFHTGGVYMAGGEITTGLPRVEELFEARNPKGQAIQTEIDGVVDISQEENGHRVTVTSEEEYREAYNINEGYQVLVSPGDAIDIGTPLAERSNGHEEDADVLSAGMAGTVEVNDGEISIVSHETDVREYLIPLTAFLTVEPGSRVEAGERLSTGPLNPQEILRILGREAVQRYLVQEVQKVYRSQGVTINDKHIEVIVRQMLRKVRVDSPGDTDLLPVQLVDRPVYEEANAQVLAQGGEPATAQAVLLGVTRASLGTESWMAAASFQETARVLTEASASGKVDHLRGLKENVIIGRLIPARFDMSPEGKERLGLPPKRIPSFLSEEGANLYLEEDMMENPEDIGLGVPTMVAGEERGGAELQADGNVAEGF